MTNSTDLKTVLGTFMEELWNSGNFEKSGDLVAESYEIKHDPGDPWEGQTLDINGFNKRIMYSRNAFPDLRFDIQEMVSEGNKVAASWIMSGTHQGDLPDLPATGRSFAISGMTIYDFKDGKVCAHYQAFDRLGFLGQMGFFEQQRPSTM